MNRVYLGWDGTPLERAAEWLIESFGSDLHGVVVALPGARSGRILQELLAHRVGARLAPPSVVTAGVLSDELLEVEGASASRLVRTLAWQRSLRGLPASALARIASRPPGDEDRGGWATLAEEVRGLFGEVAAEGLDFAAVAQSPLLEGLEGERLRWGALGQAQVGMSALLRDAGLHDPHLGRLAAIEAGQVREPRHVVLVGVVELNQLLRRTLELCAADQTALIFAPQAEREGFDEFGSLIPDRWQTREVSLTLAQWHVVDRPVDQAREAARILAGWGAEVRAEQVSIGLADAEVSPYLRSRLAEAGLRARDAAGVSMARTAPVRLLAAVAGFLRTSSFQAFSALVRHPDFEAAVVRSADVSDPLEVLDEYHGKHLPWRADGDWAAEEGDRRDQALRQRMEAVWRAAREMLGDLLSSQPAPLSQQADSLRAFLDRAFGARQLDATDTTDRLLIASLRCLSEGLSELAAVPANLAPTGALADTIDLLLQLVSSQSNNIAPTAARAGEPTIEMLGWLELPLDDAPALIVTGFEDGKVPESVRGDAYLPNGLRRDLGLADNAQRLARDLYATELLVHSRERVAFISGRRSLAGDPQVPSRIAFHCDEAEVASRVRRFLAGQVHPQQRVESSQTATPTQPRGAPAPTPETISVSAFKTFLEAPYAYYLKYILKLDTLDDRAAELDGAGFGNLAHGVLQRFGQDAGARELFDAERIAEFLSSTLRDLGVEMFGRRPLPAVQLQLQQLELRLATFARQQAERRAAGWQIHASEWSPEAGSVPLVVDGVAIGLRGRIDRIDRNDRTGEWAIWDYKTGDSVGSPLTAHRQQDGIWRDLQLPLYCLLAGELLGDQPPAELGYIALGRDARNQGFKPVADWRKPKGECDTSDEALATAYTTAHQIVREIRAGNYFDASGWKPWGEIFGALAGVGVLAAAGVVDDEEGEE